MFCPRCGGENRDDARHCASCGAQMNPAPAGPPRRARLATASLVCGLFGFLFFPAIIGLSLGIAALLQIRRSKGSLRGRGLAVAGVAVSGAALACCAALGFLVARSFIAGGHKDRGDQLVEAGKFERGLEEYRKALKIVPRWGEATNRVRWALQQAIEQRIRGDLSEGRLTAIIQVGSRIDPENETYRSLASVVSGLFLLKEGRAEAALADFQAVLGVAGGRQVPWRLGGEFAVEPVPLDGLCRALMGEALATLGRSEESLAAFDRALPHLVAPWSEYVLCRQSVVLRQAGRPDAAIRKIGECQEVDASAVPSFVGINVACPYQEIDRQSLKLEGDFPCPPHLERSVPWLWDKWPTYQRTERWGYLWKPATIRKGTSRFPSRRSPAYMLPHGDMGQNRILEERLACLRRLGQKAQAAQIAERLESIYDFEDSLRADSPRAARMWWTPLTLGFPYHIVLAPIIEGPAGRVD